MLAVEKSILFYRRDKGLDTFKDAMSVPGLASRYIFPTADESYFTVFNESNKDLFETVKGICGGPSIVFSRYHENEVTKIRNGKPCKSIMGFDANALYLYAIAQDMPTGSMIRRFESDGFKPKGKEPIAIVWLEWMMHKHNCHIRHKLNYGEKAIVKFFVDGWDPISGKIWEFNGCWHHGHSCYLNREQFNTQLNVPMSTLYEQTLKRKQELTSMGYTVIDIWECEFKHQCENGPETQQFLKSFQRPLDNVHCLSLEDIVDNVLSGNLFGAVECDIFVPPNLYGKFREMSPIFKNVNITLADVGDHSLLKVMACVINRLKASLVVCMPRKFYLLHHFSVGTWSMDWKSLVFTRLLNLKQKLALKISLMRYQMPVEQEILTHQNLF